MNLPKKDLMIPQDEKKLAVQRKIYATTRSPDATPDDELPNGQTVGEFATTTLLQIHKNRSSQQVKKK